MNFIFAGFTQTNGLRQFAFDCIADDRSKSRITVGTDLTLARKYQISMQDLPLLCRRLLEEAASAALPASLTLTEANMLAIHTAAVNAVTVRKPARRPPPSPGTAGRAWR